MNKMQCVQGVLKGATALTDSELDKIIRDFSAKKRLEAKKTAGTQTATLAKQVAEREAIRLRTEAAIQKRNAANNAIKQRLLIDQRGNYKSTSEWVEAMCVPSNRDAPGARDSASAKQEAYRGKYVGGFIAALQQSGLTEYVSTRLRDLVNPNRWGKGPLDDKVAVELWEITAEGGKPGKTGSKEAQALAKIIHQFQELARADLNRLGAYIGKIPGYIVAQTHDMSRIANGGFENWRALAEKTFGNDMTYQNLKLTGDAAKDTAIKETFWRGIYYELSTGEHFSATGESGFKGAGNMAKKVSQHRTLHPNSALDWVAYNDQFGSSSLMEAVISGLERHAKSAGLMEKFGTNPRSQFESLIAAARKHDMEHGLPVDPRTGKGGFSSRLWDVMDGTADIPARLGVAKLASATRAVIGMAKLGGAVLSSLPDIALSAARIRDTYGHNLFSAALENVSKRLAQLGDGGKQREMAMLMHIAFDGISRDISARVTSADSVNYRWVQKASQAFYKLNLLTLFQESGERAIAAMHAHRIAGMQELRFDQLDASLRGEMEKHNITAQDWDIIRKHGRHKYNDEVDMLLADKLRDMPLDAIDPVIEWPLEVMQRQAAEGLERLQKKAAVVDSKIERLIATISAQGELGQTVADLRAMRDHIKELNSADISKAQNVRALATKHERANAHNRQKIADTMERLKKSKKAEPGVLESIEKAQALADELQKAIEEWPANLDRQMNRRRELGVQELETRWNAFNIDQVHGGVIRATAREKAYATQGAQAGTPLGEAARFVMQFKQYPMAFVSQVLGRYAETDRFWSIPGALAGRIAADPGGTGVKVASLITMLTVMGYLSGAMKDIAKGRQPRDPRDPRTWGAAFVQGGGAGLYGDYLFARTNRFGGSLLESAVGPAFGTLGEAGDLALGSRDAFISDLIGDGSSEYPDVKAFNFFKNNTPFLNLFYTRAALDYLVLYQVQESLSPGSLRRMEQRLKKEQGQEFILPPSQVVR